MDEPGRGTVRYTVSVCVTATVSGDFDSVNALERAIGEATRAAGRDLYVRALGALQQQWLAQRRCRFPGQRWRRLHWLTPFGLVALPVRVVREKASGRNIFSGVLAGIPVIQIEQSYIETHDPKILLL